MRRLLAAALVATALPLALPAQTSRPAGASAAGPAELAAFALLQKQEWGTAGAAFDSLVKRDSTNGRLWFRLGLAMQGAGRDEAAFAAFERAIALNFNVGPAALNSAKAHARRRDVDEAFAMLDRMLAAGVGSPGLASDPDLSTLKGDARFARFLATADSVRYPCKHVPTYRQFDFWVGDWNVFSVPNGNQVGTNRIDLMDEGCVLLENWVSRGVQRQVGTSINYYDPGLAKWRQIYVWDTGRATEFTGHLEDRVMRFFATTTNASGVQSQIRMTFTPISKDTVTQVVEQSSDGGSTWVTTWNSRYIRKEP